MFYEKEKGILRSVRFLFVLSHCQFFPVNPLFSSVAFELALESNQFVFFLGVLGIFRVSPIDHRKKWNISFVVACLLLVPSPPRGVFMKSKEESRLVLQWRKPEETNGVIKKYVVHFTNGNGENISYTAYSEGDKENVTYEFTLPDVEAEYKIKVSLSF